MCGIGGCVVARGGAPDTRALERLGAALAHRGPDDHGLEVIGSVGLVNTRLAIVDPTPAGRQPMGAPSGRWWLTYNGEVFNHAELRRELPPSEYRSGTDTETVLRALETWGVDAVSRCNGLFAFAALDLDNRRLLLLRDRFGVKPLYFARSGDAIWFASEIRALLAAGVPRRPRADVLEHAIAVDWANGRTTPVEGVSRVLPGTAVAVDTATLEVTEALWYRPTDVVDREEARRLARLSRREVADVVERELRAAVRRRLMADVPLGTMCSGGLDSSLVTALAIQEHGDVVAFHASVADQPEAEETGWAQLAAHHLGVELHTISMTASSWRAELVDTVRHNEYPLTHVASVPISMLAGLARSVGVKALLTGEGADELLGGYAGRHIDEHANFADRHAPWRRARRLARRRLAQLGIVDRNQPAVSAQRIGRVDEIRSFEQEVVARAGRAYSHHRGSRRALETQLAGDLETYLPHLLNHQDKSTMRRSIESRLPFLDPNVVALVLNIPLEMRVSPERKGVLRDIAESHLPETIAHRPKFPFWFDARRYITEAARPEFLRAGHLREVLGVPSSEWTSSVSRLAREPGFPSLFATVLLWTAEIWCRTVLDDQPTDLVNAELWAASA